MPDVVVAIERALADAPAILCTLPALAPSMLELARAQQVGLYFSTAAGFRSAFDSRGGTRLRLPWVEPYMSQLIPRLRQPQRFLDAGDGMAVLVVPVIHVRRFFGVLQFVERTDGGPFTTDDETAACALGKVLGQAIHARCERSAVADPRYDEPAGMALRPGPVPSRGWWPGDEDRARIECLNEQPDTDAAEALLVMADESLPGYTCDAVDFLLAQRLLRLADCPAELLRRVRSFAPRTVTRASHGGPEDGVMICREEFEFRWARAAARLRLNPEAAPLPGVVARFGRRWILSSARLALEPDGRVVWDAPAVAAGSQRTGRWTAHERFLFLEFDGTWTMRAAVVSHDMPPALELTEQPGLTGFDVPARIERYRLDL